MFRVHVDGMEKGNDVSVFGNGEAFEFNISAMQKRNGKLSTSILGDSAFFVSARTAFFLMQQQHQVVR